MSKDVLEHNWVEQNGIMRCVKCGLYHNVLLSFPLEQKERYNDCNTAFAEKDKITAHINKKVIEAVLGVQNHFNEVGVPCEVRIIPILQSNTASSGNGI